MKLLVVSYYDEILIPVIREICERNCWTVCDWFVAHPSQDMRITPEGAFPAAEIHRPDFASRGMLTNTNKSDNWPALDQDIISRMALHEHMFMRMLDIYDPDGRSFTARERREAYYDLLRFGLFIIKERQPDLYIAGTIPHSLHDFILYALCKVKNIKTIIYMPISLPGYLVLHDSLEEGSSVLKSAYSHAIAHFDGSEVTLPEGIERYYQQARSSYEIAEPWYVKLRDHSFLRERTLWSWVPNPFDRANYARKFLSACKGMAIGALKYIRQPIATYKSHFITPMGDFFKENGVPLRESVTTQFAMRKIFKRGKVIKKQLYKQYKQFQVKPDLNQPFIFVPLHYQPEASTSPLGGAFVDQILMIELLASCLPHGWKIYVKEHRTTFDPGLRGNFARDSAYYPQISRIKNVMLVPLAYNSFDLIDKARVVATVTGTAGWEAVLRGVPAIIFGNAWYKECDGVFDGRTEATCRQAMELIKTGFEVNQKKVRLFMSMVCNIGVYADRDNSYVLTNLSQEESRIALIQHFIRESTRMGLGNVGRAGHD